MDKEAIEKIARWIVGQYTGHSWSELSPDEKEGFRDDAGEIDAIYKSLGYIPPGKVISVKGNDIEDFIEASALEDWAKSRGYVQLDKDQRYELAIKLVQEFGINNLTHEILKRRLVKHE